MSNNQTEEGRPATSLTAREHAALALRFPDSGTPWLDEMIAKARMLDTMTAIVAQRVRDLEPDTAIEEADRYASALLDDATFEPRLIPEPEPSAPAVKAMEWRACSLEAPEKSCNGCYFSSEMQGGDTSECGRLQSSCLHVEVFGRNCSTRNVIYVKAAP